MSSAPDELSVLAGLLPAPDGSPVVFIGPIWSGESGQGQEIMARLQSLGTPILNQIGPMSYADLIRLYDAQVVNGRHYALQTAGWLISPLISSPPWSPPALVGRHRFPSSPCTTSMGQARKSPLMRPPSACVGSTS